ncbi:MAG TPA: UDP-N-acetylmuramate:L-alanyl-gamma-D-glutamyl-meso-diaminopimelate ligase, partial [Blastocatellia bacterium]|nr:UDP-N-acetylmuramate:L-alanyl-gamma-D-glutamyl-meso-diaminopimelate ligase [Blastocatellia bacterium]
RAAILNLDPKCWSELLHKKHFHLIGICGTAMASLAGMLVAQGHEVTGSDENVYPPMSTELERMVIPISAAYRPENVDRRPDIVVVGNAITRGNPELEFVLNEKIPYTSMAAVVKENFIRGHHSVVVAGTHGKTTTTSLMAWAMERAGANPSFLIGGVAENFNSSFRVTDSPYFVIEGDEYDTAYFDKGPKFMHYLPDTVILNNIEFDHADIYRDLEAVKFAFSRLINLIPGRGALIAGWDSAIVRELSARALCRVESFGTEEGAQWRATDIDFAGELTTFTVTAEGREYGRYRTPLAGMFNVRNCLGVIAASEALGLDRNQIVEALAEFKSVKRRMQVRAVVRGVTVIDDFAHHPTAVLETLLAARQKYPDHRVIAVFEPRSYTAQRREFQQDFENALAGADKIIIAGLFHPERYSADTAIAPDKMIEGLRERGLEADFIPSTAEIVPHLAERLKSNDVVVIMSNGSFGGLHDKLIASLKESEKG